MKDSEQGISNLVMVLIAAIIILVGICAVYVTYASQQRRINDLNNQVSTLQNQSNKSCPSSLSQSETNQICPDYSYKSVKGVTATVYTPMKNDISSSPVGVIGKIPGNWSSEAQFPVKLLDSQGNVVAQAPATILGTWQTTNPEPFSVQLTYSASLAGTGTLILQKDNPSGLPANDDSISIPIRF